MTDGRPRGTAIPESPVTPAGRRTPARRSVFAKLLAIMAAMAVCLLLLVTAFFWLALGPTLDTLHRMTGPAGAGHAVPHESAAAASGAVTSAPLLDSHVTLLLVLLVLLAAVIVVAHVVLKRLLRPLRDLGDGAARLGAGQLDVLVPTRTRDEFGALTATFNEMAGRVKEMIGARDQLLLDVSHELRSPVTRMRVALELLPDGDQRTRLAADVAEIERMIGELLEFERLRDPRGIRTTRQDLLPLLQDVAAAFRDRPPGVRVTAGVDEIPVEIDPERVRTVIRNVLDNALKYSTPASHPVEISASAGADGVVVRVSDDGVGIPPEDVERVFQPFFRVDRSRSRHTGGYGLGLSICRRVMEAHRGTIAVERHAGRGTVVVLTLPKAGHAKST